MIHYVDKVIPEHIKQEYSHTTCDSCNKIIRDFDPEACISFENIEYICTGREGTKLSVELCSKCFNDKLIPWFKENSIVLTTTKIND